VDLGVDTQEEMQRSFGWAAGQDIVIQAKNYQEFPCLLLRREMLHRL
jgi:hypothetical protein